MLALTINHTTEYLPETDSDDAMMRFWKARQGGDSTARLIKIDKIPTDDNDDDDPPPVAPGQVSQIAQKRIAKQEEWLSESGFRLPQPLFAPGTKVIDLGEENFRMERKRVEDMPLFPDAASLVTCSISREQREDRQVPLHEIEMTDRGTLVAGGEEFAMEAGAFYQLATLTGFGNGARYLADACSPALRATNVNTQIREARNRTLTLRTRMSGSGKRSIFATVTPTYSAVDSDQVLGAVCQALSDAHTEMSYDGNGIRATALWMPDQVKDLAAGDVFKVGVRVETDDTGRGRIRISGVAFRNLCLNLIIIGEGEVETVSQVHRGDPQRILATVQEGVLKARESIANFLEAWKHARTVKVNATEVLREWVESRKLRIPGVRSAKARDEAVEALLGSWQKEPGDTLADAVNAVTRAAHETPFWGVDIREELERQAARLVLVPR